MNGVNLGFFLILTSHPLGISVSDGFVKAPLPSGISVFSLPSFQNPLKVPRHLKHGKLTAHTGTINSFYYFFIVTT